MIDVVFSERAIVGLALIEPTVIDRHELALGGYAWTDEPIGQLWSLICGLRRDGVPISDVRLVVEAARTQSILDGMGGVSAIGRIVAEGAAMPGQDGYHVAQLVDASERSRLRRLADSIHTMADSDNSPDEIISFVSARLHSVSSSKALTRSIGELARLAIDEATKPTGPKGVMCGLYDLDYLTGGFRPGDMVVLAARPSIGKSAMAAQWAIHAAKAGHATLFVSLEMRALDVASRALALEGAVDMASIRDRRLDGLNLDAANRTAEKLRTVPMRITDHRNLTIDRLTALVRSEASRTKLGLVVVDYIGLLSSSNNRKPRWESMTEISNALKGLAIAESIPIVALCQLNRESEGEQPKLSHLRESGAIEQDADIVCLLHRESRQSDEASLLVAKHRNGETGKLKLTFDAARFRFDNYHAPEVWQP